MKIPRRLSAQPITAAKVWLRRWIILCPWTIKKVVGVCVCQIGKMGADRNHHTQALDDEMRWKNRLIVVHCTYTVFIKLLPIWTNKLILTGKRPPGHFLTGYPVTFSRKARNFQNRFLDLWIPDFSNVSTVVRDVLAIRCTRLKWVFDKDRKFENAKPSELTQILPPCYLKHAKTFTWKKTTDDTWSVFNANL